MKTTAKALTKKWITDYYGHRCKEYCKGCIVCQKWRQFDKLFEDFTEYERITKTPCLLIK